MDIIKLIPNDLLEVKESVEEHIQEFVEEKIENADIPEKAINEIQEFQDEIIEEIKEKLEELNNGIDDTIYHYSDQYIKDIKADLKYQDEKEADLWNY